MLWRMVVEDVRKWISRFNLLSLAILYFWKCDRPRIEKSYENTAESSTTVGKCTSLQLQDFHLGLLFPKHKTALSLSPKSRFVWTFLNSNQTYHSYHIKLRNFSLTSISSLVKCYLKLIRYLMLNFGNSVEAIRIFRAVPKSHISWTLVGMFFTTTDGSNAF